MQICISNHHTPLHVTVQNTVMILPILDVSRRLLGVASCSNVVGPFCPHFQGEDGEGMVLQNVVILPHHYTASQSRRLQWDGAARSFKML